jgi:hypothetical protein
MIRERARARERENAHQQELPRHFSLRHATFTYSRELIGPRRMPPPFVTFLVLF